jgi:hypothetical protein
MAVWQEMQTMKRLAGSFIAPDGEDGRKNSNVYQVIVNIQNYLYKRPDNINGGYNYHTKTTQMEKERFMNTFRDGVERGIIVVNSVELLKEAKHVQREEGVIGAPGRGKDDRVIAGGLAAIAWSDFVRLRLAQIGHTRKSATAAQNSGQSVNPVARSVHNYLKTLGIQEPAGAAALQRRHSFR